jgi:hypothetical protein
MLLFLLHDNFRELPEAPRAARVARKFCRDAKALLGAGLFLSAWCLLRLLVKSGEGFNFDIALALGCLCLGVRAVLRSLRTLRG